MYKIVVAPSSNDSARDWHISNYEKLVNLICSDERFLVQVIGSSEQRLHHLLKIKPCANLEIRTGLDSWVDTIKNIESADLVIANNSGVAHLAGDLGKNTVVIFCSSHDPKEWGGNGKFTRIFYNEVPCSPCGLTGTDCPFDHFCMNGIEPEYIYSYVMELFRNEK